MNVRPHEIHESCAINRGAAIDIINDKLDWSRGLMFSVLYRDLDNKVQIITAIGIKNSDECGPSGIMDSDEWNNTYYESSLNARGEGFYRIMSDTGFNGGNDESFTGDVGDLYTTRVNVNGAYYDVLNSKEDMEIEDPFHIQEL